VAECRSRRAFGRIGLRRQRQRATQIIEILLVRTLRRFVKPLRHHHFRSPAGRAAPIGKANSRASKRLRRFAQRRGAKAEWQAQPDWTLEKIERDDRKFHIIAHDD